MSRPPSRTLLRIDELAQRRTGRATYDRVIAEIGLEAFEADRAQLREWQIAVRRIRTAERAAADRDGRQGVWSEQLVLEAEAP